MAVAVFFVFGSLVGVIAQEMRLEADRPSMRVTVSDQATLKCCCNKEPSNFTWIKYQSNSKMVHVTLSDFVVKGNQSVHRDLWCGTLTFKSVQLNDTGLYQCYLTGTIFTYGTYLQVYEPMKKTINLSESTKNTILMVEGILLFLCVLVPSSILLFKSNRLNELEMKKAKREEENIYQGLNLDDCCTTYDQIERSQAQDPYQDVGNIMEEREEIQLEKP
ncbi:B-cell antigen receptor complex-associated protein alpha chain [Cololabis saira]|uniref:B-cell antigen receptor complex-associated protein alpha chain n=1 Tax=Cololabis saira TaxID=129043 RepID=UPI002AD37E05|nr:B-cell antigen receptor complex-associated protein alpha chain [Cololabis saira]